MGSIFEILKPQPQAKIILLPLLLLFNICSFYKCKVQPNHFIKVLSSGAQSLCRDWQQRWAGEVHWPWCSPGILSSPNPLVPPPHTFQRKGLAWGPREVWFTELPSCINNSACSKSRDSSDPSECCGDWWYSQPSGHSKEWGQKDELECSSSLLGRMSASWGRWWSVHLCLLENLPRRG